VIKKKIVIYTLLFVVIGMMIGAGYWVYTVGSANVWGGSGTVEDKHEGNVKEKDHQIYVEFYVTRYDTLTGTLAYDGGKYYVDVPVGKVYLDDKSVVAVKSETGRIITSQNARFYKNKRVQVVIKRKEKMVIDPQKAEGVEFIDPDTGKAIPVSRLSDYKDKNIIVVRKLDKPAVWLVAGIDSRGSLLYGHNDSVMLVFVNPKTSSITILSIPRDVIVYIPRLRSYTKLAHAFIYSKAGEPEDGAKSLIDTIEYNFGVHIDRYIIFSFQGVADVVDAIGGIDVHLNSRICCHSHDWACRGGTCLGPGDVHLDGRKFLVYWRSRTSDIERVERQMSFLTSPEMKKQIIDKLSLSLADDLMKIWGSKVVSDTSPDKWIKLAYDIRNYHIEAESLKVYDVWGCYASDLQVEVSALKYDDVWLKDFYVRVFGEDLADQFIKGIKPDRNVPPMGHCVKEEKKEDNTGNGKSTGSNTMSSTQTITPSQTYTSTSAETPTTSSTPTSTETATSTQPVSGDSTETVSSTETITSSQPQTSTTTTTGSTTATSSTATTASSSATASTATQSGDQP